MAAALAAASSAARILSGVSVMSVGRSEVVPNFRCAAAIAAMPSTVGSSCEEDIAAAIDGNR